jgi:hypothetical protein
MKKFLISVINALPIDNLRMPEKNNGSDDKE